jgi:hypothetical protein
MSIYMPPSILQKHSEHGIPPLLLEATNYAKDRTSSVNIFGRLTRS